MWALYNLFKDVDKKVAMLMVILVSVSAAIGIVNIVNTMAPLVLLSGADFLSVFTKPQLDALALGFLRLHGYGLVVDEAFWGLWLFPFGVLVITGNQMWVLSQGPGHLPDRRVLRLSGGVFHRHRLPRSGARRQPDRTAVSCPRGVADMDLASEGARRDTIRDSDCHLSRPRPSLAVASDMKSRARGTSRLLIGYLVFKSTFLPRTLGALMASGGLSWLTFLSPPLANYLSPYNYAPGILGEGWLTVWLLVMGVDEQRWKEQAGVADALAIPEHT